MSKDNKTGHTWTLPDVPGSGIVAHGVVESIPKCRTCDKPLKWDVLGRLDTTTKTWAANAPPFGTPVAERRHKDALKEVARVEAYRATHKRGYLGAGDFCGQLCAATWAQGIMNAMRAGTVRITAGPGHARAMPIERGK